jgi:predicted MPP superfamily phosphohydrolase
MLLAESPDLILIPGDLFQGSAEAFARELPALRALVDRLAAPAGVFFVLGNSDRPAAETETVFAGSAVRFLRGETVTVRVRDREITIAGLDENWRSAASKAALARLAEAPGASDLRIALVHYPDAALDLPPRSRVDLLVAGHTHGGQIVVPFFGPPLTLSAVPRRVGAGGLHAMNGNQVYVSRGIGVERGEAPRIRFFCPPEVTLIEIGAAPGERLP